MNTDATKYEALIVDHSAAWRAKFIAQGAIVEPPPVHLTLAERIWPWASVLAFVALMGLMEHWS